MKSIFTIISISLVGLAAIGAPWPPEVLSTYTMAGTVQTYICPAELRGIAKTICQAHRQDLRRLSSAAALPVLTVVDAETVQFPLAGSQVLIKRGQTHSAFLVNGRVVDLHRMKGYVDVVQAVEKGLAQPLHALMQMAIPAASAQSQEALVANLAIAKLITSSYAVTSCDQYEEFGFQCLEVGRAVRQSISGARAQEQKPNQDVREQAQAKKEALQDLDMLHKTLNVLAAKIREGSSPLFEPDEANLMTCHCKASPKECEDNSKIKRIQSNVSQCKGWIAQLQKDSDVGPDARRAIDDINRFLLQTDPTVQKVKPFGTPEGAQ